MYIHVCHRPLWCNMYILYMYMGTWDEIVCTVLTSIYSILVFHAGHHKMTISDILSQAFEEMDVPLPTED